MQAWKKIERKQVVEREVSEGHVSDFLNTMRQHGGDGWRSGEASLMAYTSDERNWSPWKTQLNNLKGGRKRESLRKMRQQNEPLADRCLEYTVFRGLKGERESVDCSQVRNYQSTAPLLLHVDIRSARKHLVGVPVFVVQRHNSWRSCSASKSAMLCSQVSSLCRASLWNNSVTLAAPQYSHNQSCHQPAVQT